MNTAAPKKRGRRPKDPRLVLDALGTLLADRPLHEIGIEDILESAGVSRATFYVHFATKYAAVEALFNQVLAEISTTMGTFVSQSAEAPALEALRIGIDDSTAVWFRHRVILETVVQNAHVVPEFATILNKMKSDFARTIAREVERERAAGKAPPGPPARQLCAALVECTLALLYSAGLDQSKDLPGPGAIANSIYALWCGTVYYIPPPGNGADLLDAPCAL